MLLPLRDLVASLSIHSQLPQIELAVGAHVTALVLRIMVFNAPADEQQLKSLPINMACNFGYKPKGQKRHTRFTPWMRLN